MFRRLILCFLTLAGLAWLEADRSAVADSEKPKDAPVSVTVDTKEVPELADWGDKAKKLVEKWHPIVVDLLKSDGYTPPAKVHIVFKKKQKIIAFAHRNTISISAAWVKEHPDDFGMVIHEMTHTLQGYRGKPPGWLVEGIADYIRFFKFEPDKKITIRRRRASYKEGYRTTARFLDWVQTHYDKALVSKINAAMRQGKYKDELFQTYTKKTLDELWAGFIKSLGGEKT